ncbi:MAG: hypothetical protein LBC18_03065 [Opitutaceae bacterium]|jgi:hypothetical protein|nr:hypothetical protein [Opitutaceae bacterium]
MTHTVHCDYPHLCDEVREWRFIARVMFALCVASNAAWLLFALLRS